MSEYFHVEKPFLDQLAALGWNVTDQGHGFIPSDPAKSLRTNFREWFLPNVFRNAIRANNLTPDAKPWLTDRQIGDLRDQILRQPNLTLLEADETTQGLFLKIQVDRNEVTGEADPVVKLIDFIQPERDEQDRICKRYASVDSQLEAQRDKQDKLLNLKRGLMHDLLTGRVYLPAAEHKEVAI